MFFPERSNLRMATEKHDVVIAGGGHNGLIVAAYLAKAGLDVCVVERQDVVGGGAVTRELTLPGFKHDVGSIMHGFIQANPLIHRDELGLKSKYGLKYIFPSPQIAILFPDDRAIFIDRDVGKTCESIAQFSARDAEMYPKFLGACRQMSKMATVATFSDPIPFGKMVSFLDASEDGQDYLRTILSSCMDIVDEWFESDEMKLAITRYASELMIGPHEQGTGNGIFGYALFHAWGWGLPEGGSGALSEALAAFIRDNGGTIKVSSTVKAINVEGGEARGVILDSGEEIEAKKAVVSNLNVKQLFLDMVKAEELPPGFSERVRRIKHAAYSAMNQAIALKEPLKYKAGGDLDKAWSVHFTPWDSLRIFDEYTYGLPSTEMPAAAVPTLVDPTRAPEGKHTLYLYHYEPYSLKDGGAARWDEIKEEVADGILETVRKHVTNLGPENILGREILSPLDMERYNPSFINGDVSHIGAYVSQLFANRPLPGWGHYKTPIEKLYMCGASTHAGGGILGAGRAAVQVIMEDFGLDFKKVLEK
jgi:phytoene dehydrogenase-like protein